MNSASQSVCFMYQIKGVYRRFQTNVKDAADNLRNGMNCEITPEETGA